MVNWSTPYPNSKKKKNKAKNKAADRLRKHEARDTSSNLKLVGGWSLKEQLVGASSISPQGVDAVQTRVNYFVGSDKSKWHSSIPTYNMVSLGQVYPGIDLNLRARGNNTEKIFTVHPGADVEQIKLKVEGANSLAINAQGELEIGTGLGPVCFSKPVAYQESDGRREYVQAAYHLDKDNYGFTVGDYDKSRPLVIDPLLASTFISGGGSLSSLASDSVGYVYVAGYTWSDDYLSTPGAYDSSYNGNGDVLITKLDADLSTLLACTFIGGSDGDSPNSLAIDSADNVYVAGYTKSTNYPTTAGAYDTSYNLGFYDVFVSKLDANLSTLLASSFIGGSDWDSPNSLATDSAGNVYVGGFTFSSNYPTTAGAYDTSYSGSNDAFVSRLDASLSTLLASTLIGGNNTDYAQSIAIDSTGNVYVAGATNSSDYPTTAGAHDSSYNGDDDVLISKLDAGLSTLLASTFIGGSDYDGAYTLAIDNTGSVYVAGDTESTDYPITTGVYDPSLNGEYDAFVSKLDADLSTLGTSTFLGGSDYDYVYSLAIDGVGNIYVAGDTWSDDYPTTAGAYNPSYNGNDDVLISKLDADLSTLLASTFVGGSDADYDCSLAIDNLGNVYAAGITYSDDYPTTSGSYRPSIDAWGKLFISKLSGDLSADAATIDPPDKFTLGKFTCGFYGQDPVNLSTGNFIFETTDLKIPGRGLPLEFTRFYNSIDDYNGPLGACPKTMDP